MQNHTVAPSLSTVSIVIPCFNDGLYLEETLACAQRQTHPHIEIIIVDDHSTDETTRNILSRLRESGLTVLSSPPQKKGAAVARNTGIAQAKGPYILPLDADDRLEPDYAAKAVAVLDARSDVGICYCQADFFGLKKGRWELPAFSLETMLFRNIIFISAIFRKQDWACVGGFAEMPADCQEDHLFWLALIKSGVGVVQLPEVLFHYRIRAHSRAAGLRVNNTASLRAPLTVHKDLYEKHLDVLYDACMALYQEKDCREHMVLWGFLAPCLRFEAWLRNAIKRRMGR